MSKQNVWVLRCLFLLLSTAPAARTLLKGGDFGAVRIPELGITGSSGRLPGSVTVDWLKANRGKFGQACDRKDLLEAAIDKLFSVSSATTEAGCQEWADGFVPDELTPAMSHFLWPTTIVGRSSLLAFCSFEKQRARSLLTRGSSTYFMASGQECRTITGGHQVIIMVPLDAEDQATLDMDLVVKYGIKAYTEVAQDPQHTLEMDKQYSGDKVYEASAEVQPLTPSEVSSVTVDWLSSHHGQESPACSRSDLLQDEIITLSGLFTLGSAGKCMEWAGAFVADDSELGPPNLLNFQWKKVMVGKGSVIAFCEFARWLATANNLDPSKIIKLAPSAYFVASGQECRVIASYTGLSKDGGLWLLSMSPLDADGHVTLDMQNVRKYGVTSFTEVAGSEKFLL